MTKFTYGIPYLTLAAYLLLSGCNLMPVKEKIVYVDIPTPVSCVTWTPDQVASRFSDLHGDEPLYEQIKALLIDRENDKRLVEGQQAVINGCKD